MASAKSTEDIKERLKKLRLGVEYGRGHITKKETPTSSASSSVPAEEGRGYITKKETDLPTLEKNMLILSKEFDKQLEDTLILLDDLYTLLSAGEKYIELANEVLSRYIKSKHELQLIRKRYLDTLFELLSRTKEETKKEDYRRSYEKVTRAISIDDIQVYLTKKGISKEIIYDKIEQLKELITDIETKKINLTKTPSLSVSSFGTIELLKEEVMKEIEKEIIGLFKNIINTLYNLYVAYYKIKKDIPDFIKKYRHVRTFSKHAPNLVKELSMNLNVIIKNLKIYKDLKLKLELELEDIETTYYLETIVSEYRESKTINKEFMIESLIAMELKIPDDKYHDLSNTLNMFLLEVNTTDFYDKIIKDVETILKSNALPYSEKAFLKLKNLDDAIKVFEDFSVIEDVPAEASASTGFFGLKLWGGGNEKYFKKYLKYKQKYINLRKKLRN